MNTKSKASNPIIQNLKLKEYIGWFAAIIFPFASLGIFKITGLGIVGAVVYFAFCGYLLRRFAGNSLPYLNPKPDAVFEHIVRMSAVFVLFALIIYSWFEFRTYTIMQSVMLIIFFVLMKGLFEQLVTINVFELAGSRIKLTGYAAAILSSVIMFVAFWEKFLDVPFMNGVVLVILQVLLNIFAINVYRKTKDITISCIFQIILNLAIIFFCSFNSTAYIII